VSAIKSILHNLFFIAALFFAPHSAFSEEMAQANSGIAQCAAQDTDAARLICYDTLARRLGVDGPIVSHANAGQWRIRTEVSAIDDTTNVFLSLDAKTAFRGWLDEEVGTLMIRCKENRTQAYIITGMTAQSGYRRHDESQVTVRYDRNDAVRIWMSESTDNKALFFPNPISEIKRMVKHESMLFQFSPFNASPTMTTFEIAGLSEALVPLREACQW